MKNLPGKVGKVVGGITFLVSLHFLLTGHLLPVGGSASSLVDGYKNYKFGISISQLRAFKPCSLGQAQHSSEAPKVTSYDCPDFNFDGKRTSASFIFVDDELLRVAIMTGTTTAEGYALINPLDQKYGSPSSYDKDRANAFDNGSVTVFEAAWADNSVILRFQHVDGHFLSSLIYTSDVYQARAFSGARAVANDL